MKSTPVTFYRTHSTEHTPVTNVATQTSGWSTVFALTKALLG